MGCITDLNSSGVLLLGLKDGAIWVIQNIRKMQCATAGLKTEPFKMGTGNFKVEKGQQARNGESQPSNQRTGFCQQIELSKKSS